MVLLSGQSVSLVYGLIPVQHLLDREQLRERLLDITSSSLSRGSYTFYANTTESSQTSDCSSASVAYAVRPTAPSGLSLNDPSSTPDDDRTPSITISGVVSGQTVRLFRDSLCSTEVGAEVSTGTTINITSSSLDRGSYTFYANTTRGGTNFYLFNCQCKLRGEANRSYWA